MALSTHLAPESDPVAPAAVGEQPLEIAATLRGERLFVTGATGFIGKVLVEKILWSVPEVGKLYLLVRAEDDRAAGERLRAELFDSPVMARLQALHGDDWERWVAARVEAVAGDLAHERLGMEPGRYTEVCGQIDRVIGCAATVRFDERLDRALELNTRGALRTLELACDAGSVPLAHVSTCFVSGRRQGPVWEEIGPRPRWASGRGGGGTEADPDLTLASLEGACWWIRSQLAAAAAGDADAPWIAAGAAQAARHGFHDVYTLTKDLGERLLARDRDAVPVAILRPAIVESALAEPIPGWIEAVRVADPLLVSYGRGVSRDIPGAADAPLEIVPVDLVVNALLAALVDLRQGEEALRIFQVSSNRNRITLGELVTYAREGFTRFPLRDAEGEPIAVGRPRFVEPNRLRRALVDQRDGKRRARLGKRVLEHFIRLIDVYRPYLDHRARYADQATRGLWSRLSPEEREVFPLDVGRLDWRSYIADVHIPGLVRFALKAETGAPPPGAAPAEPAASAAEHADRAASLFELFRATAEAAPDTMAFQTCRDGRWLRYTYAQALTATQNIAWRLATRYGIGRGDRVALWASGSPEWVLTMFALHRLGAVTVPLDPQWPVADVEAAVRFVGARLVCVAPALAPRLAASDLPSVELGAPLVPAPDVGPLPGSAGHDAGVGEHDLATLVFTSGTTVAPKAVPLTHGNLLANVRDLVPLMELSRERLLSVLPIHHVFELMVGLLVPIAGASTVSYVSELKPAEISWMMATTRPTVLVAVPRILELLHGGIFQSVAAGGPWLGRLFRVLFALSRLTGGRIGHLLFAKVHRRFGGSLRRIATGGSALEPGLGRSFQLMGFRVAEGYGMTETSPVLTVNPWGALRFGSVGRPLPGVEVDIRPAAGAIGAAGGEGEGEIWVRGANVMSGYWADPEATAAAMEESGWLDTGDLGRFDADGYLHICGRTKDVIVTAAGKNVYPEEVEARYRDLPGVAELVVLGLPVNGAGTAERVAAVVVPAAAEDGDEAALARIRAAIDARSSQLPSYQRIGSVELWRGDLPKTTTLKVQRGRLRDAILAGERGREAATRAASPAAPAEVAAPPAEEQTWILDTLARLTRSRRELLTAEERLADLGVDSLTRVELVGVIEERFGLRLDDETASSLERVGDLLALTTVPANARGRLTRVAPGPLSGEVG